MTIPHYATQPGEFFDPAKANSGPFAVILVNNLIDKINASLIPAINVMGYGAVGDGIADDTVAIAAAMTAGAGGTVYVPSGTYLVTSTITVPKGTKVVGGGGSQLYPGWTTPAGGNGSLFKITHTSGVAFKLERGSVLDGLNFWYPNQTVTGAPVVYDYCLSLNFDVAPGESHNNAMVRIKNCVIHNAYKGIDLDGDPLGTASYAEVIMENLCIGALLVGIHAGQSFTDCSLVDCLINTLYTGRTDNGLWAVQNGAGIWFEGGQGFQATNSSIFGFKQAILLSNPSASIAQGPITFLIWNGGYIDGCWRGIDVQGNMSLNDSVFAGMEINTVDTYFGTPLAAGSVGLNINSDNAQEVHFSGVRFLGPANVKVRSPSGSGFKTIDLRDCTLGGAPNSGINVDCDDTLATIIAGVIVINGAATGTIAFKIANARGLQIVNYYSQDTHTKPFEVSGVYYQLSVGSINTYSDTPSTWPTSFFGSDIASATTITIPDRTGYIWNITGTTTITGITASWPGRLVTLKFAGILTLTDGSNLKLAGNFVTSADDSITLICDGVSWFEVARSVN